MPNFSVDKQTRNLAEMLSSAFEEAGQRGKKSVEVCGSSFHFCTSRGTKRENNQDHVAVFRVSPTKQNAKEIIIAAVADGMGGTAEGKKAAQLSLSYFCAILATSMNSPLTLKAIEKAAVDTNRSVYTALRGKGGSTFVAIVYKGGNTFIVNIGDSRAYSVSCSSIDQLTVDDTMQSDKINNYIEKWDNYKLKDNRILQHMGLDGKISPKVFKVKNTSKDQSLLVTTDGAHYIGHDMIQAIVCNCNEIKDIPLRLVSVSEWLSGHDNATVLLCPSSVDSLPSGGDSEFINVKVETILKSSVVSIRDKEDRFINTVRVYPRIINGIMEKKRL